MNKLKVNNFKKILSTKNTIFFGIGYLYGLGTGLYNGLTLDIKNINNILSNNLPITLKED